MFANVLNSVDYQLIFGLFESHCVPNMSQKPFNSPHANWFEKTKDGQSEACDLYGADLIAQYWHRTFSSGPDSMVRVSNSKIFHSNNSDRCKIETNFVFSITKIVQNEDSQTVDTQSLSSNCEVSRFKTILSGSSGKFTMYVDENRKICRLEVEKYSSKRHELV
jgi:hypothetical protein